MLYGGNTNAFLAQVEGSAFFVGALLASGLLLMFSLKWMGVLRISAAGELEGLDIHDHGAPAYHPEPAYEGYSPIPAGIGGGGNGGVGAPVMASTASPTSE